MDCRQFREDHLAYLDASLPAAELAAMEEHASVCEPCASHDRAVRRGLQLCRTMPRIEPSKGFTSRLNARLSAVRRAREASRRFRGPSPVVFAAAAAGVVVAGALAAAALERAFPPRDIVLPPVIASRPESRPSPLASPSVIATASSGVPMWPAVLLADQAPVHFARAELRLTSLAR
jgi:anti-sigma factor RsiW